MARIAAAVVLLLASVGSAFGECAWVFWSQSQHQPNPASECSRHAVYPNYSACWSRFYEITGIPQKDSLRDWIDWTNHRGRYAKLDLAVAAHIIVVEDGVEMYSSSDRVTSVHCFPDTVDPRGQKARG